MARDEVEDQDEEDVEVVRESSCGTKRVGNYSVQQVVKMMSGIPSKPDWVEMSGSGLNGIFQKCAEHWAEVKFPFYNFFLSHPYRS